MDLGDTRPVASFPRKLSMNKGTADVFSAIFQSLWATNRVHSKLLRGRASSHILIERHCSKATLGIWMECDKFCQSKYGLINELAS